MRLWSKWALLSGAERVLLLRALGAVAGFRLALWVVPFPRLKRHLETISPRTPKKQVSPAQIGRAVGRASRIVPRSTCLVQALATQWLLRRENKVSLLHVGVVKRDEDLLVHAWVEWDGGVVVVGAGGEGCAAGLRWGGQVGGHCGP